MHNSLPGPALPFGDHLWPSWDDIAVGTCLDYDVYLGPDHRTIDINLFFKHHTAPPSKISRLVQFHEVQGGRLAEIDVPVFYRHETAAQIVMSVDTSRIIAMWRPSGLPKYAINDLMQIAFLRTSASGGYQIKRIR